MAAVDLNNVQFWAPPTNPFLYKQRTPSSQSMGRPICTNSSRNQPAPLYNKEGRTFKRNDQSKSAVTAARRPGDDSAAGAQGRNNDSTNRDDEADDLPSIEENLGPLLRKELAAEGCQNSEDTLDTSGSRLGPTQSRLDNDVGDSQGTRDRPVILEDDEPGSTDPEADSEAASVSASVKAGAIPAFELSKPINPSDHEAWYNVEDDRFVDEDLRPLPPLQQECLTSTPAQDQPHSRHHSRGLSQDQTNQYDNDGTTRSVSEEPAPQSIPIPLDKDSGGWNEENVSELAFEEHEKLSAISPSSPRPRRSAEPSHPQINQELDQGGTSHGRLEGLGYSSRLYNKECPREQQGQEEEVVDAIRKEDDDDDGREREQRGEKRQHQDEEISSGVYHSKSSGYSHDTNDKDDESIRPAKRRRLHPVYTDMPLTPPLEHGPKPRLRQPHRLPPSSTTQREIDDAQSQAEIAHLPTPVDNEHHYTPRTSRSPSAPVAEYQEWPFQGFLKRTRIGNETTYNLEFQLPYIPEHLHLPIPSEALGMGSNKATYTDATPPRSAVAHSKVRPAAVRRQITRLLWTPEEDATVLEMKEDGCSWEDIHTALPHRSKGTIQVRYYTKLKK